MQRPRPNRASHARLFQSTERVVRTQRDASVLFCPSAPAGSLVARTGRAPLAPDAYRVRPAFLCVTYPLIPLQPNGLRRGAACNALASPAHLSAEWLSYGRNVMRPQLAPRCGVAFLIISCPLVARTGRPPLGPLHATPLRLRRLISPEWSSYGRNVMRPQFGTTCRRCDLPLDRSSLAPPSA